MDAPADPASAAPASAEINSALPSKPNETSLPNDPPASFTKENSSALLNTTAPVNGIHAPSPPASKPLSAAELSGAGDASSAAPGLSSSTLAVNSATAPLAASVAAPALDPPVNAPAAPADLPPAAAAPPPTSISAIMDPIQTSPLAVNDPVTHARPSIENLIDPSPSIQATPPTGSAAVDALPAQSTAATISAQGAESPLPSDPNLSSKPNEQVASSIGNLVSSSEAAPSSTLRTDPAVQPVLSDLRSSTEPATDAQASEIREEKHRKDLAADPALSSELPPVATAPIARAITPISDLLHSSAPLQDPATSTMPSTNGVEDLKSATIEAETKVPAAPETASSLTTSLEAAKKEQPEEPPAPLPTPAPEAASLPLPSQASDRPSPVPASSTAGQADVKPSATSISDVPPAHDTPMVDAPASPSKLAREREEDSTVEEPASKRTKVEDGSLDGAVSDLPAAEPLKAESISETKDVPMSDAPAAASADTGTQSGATASATGAPVESTSSTAGAASAMLPPISTTTLGDAAGTMSAAPTPISATFVPPARNASGKFPAPLPREIGPELEHPITILQQKHLLKGVANIKKGNHAAFFMHPVDPVALRIPTYPDIIKEPMDLRTLEARLKANEYPTLAAYFRDFDLLAANTIRFNGVDHDVSQHGIQMRHAFDRHLNALPSRDATELEKKPKKLSEPKPPSQRRESRSMQAPPKTPTAGSPTQTFALGPQGIPLIRRDSAVADGRPRREIHPPAPKDLPYATQKPRKKKYQWELKFCQHVLEQLKRPVNWNLTSPFLHPVDPVAMNIPTYHKVIKKPMDLQTVENKLKAGQYETAKEFEADIRLMLANCFKFNPPEHPVNKAGHDLEMLFEDLWQGKRQWLNTHAPNSGGQSPESSVEPEDDDDDDDADEDGDEDQANEIDTIKQAIAKMQKQVESMEKKKRPTPPAPSGAGFGSKKSKSGGKASGKKDGKRGSLGGGKADKKGSKSGGSKPKKIPFVTYEQKQDISNRINSLPEDKMQTALQIIRSNMNLKGQDDDEIELDIDELPNDVLYKLLTFVRKYAPLPTDSESTPAGSGHRGNSGRGRGHGGSGAARPKKNKPMNSKEQERQIEQLRGTLDSMHGATAGNSALMSDSDDKAAESSGDDDTEESEED